jgi:hypothetical protein
MLTFRIPPNGIKEIRKKMLLYGIPFSLISIAITLLITFSIYDDGHEQIKPDSELYNTSSPYDWLSWAIPVIIIVTVAGFSTVRTLRRVKKMYESYELTISENLIAREQVNTPTISIYLGEVEEIIKRRNKGFMVRGKTERDIILIPAQIENYDQLETALNEIKPITRKGKTTTLLRVRGLLGLLAIVLMICVYTVENKIIVGVAGILFTGIYIYSFILTQKSKNIDYRTKRKRWVILLMVLIILGFTILKLTDQLQY